MLSTHCLLPLRTSCLLLAKPDLKSSPLLVRCWISAATQRERTNLMTLGRDAVVISETLISAARFGPLCSACFCSAVLQTLEKEQLVLWLAKASSS